MLGICGVDLCVDADLLLSFAGDGALFQFLIFLFFCFVIIVPLFLYSFDILFPGILITLVLF